MDVFTLNNLMNDLLLAELGVGLDGLAAQLARAEQGWASMGADPSTTAFLRGIVDELGWWRGRIDAALDPLSETL